jgi:hypothetical protein
MKLTRALTDKQHQILIFLYRFRYLDRRQIQHLLHHKSDSRIHMWLHTLLTHGYIARNYSTAYTENTKPAIYYLMPKSILYLRTVLGLTAPQLKYIYRDRTRSEKFIHHTLLVADLCLYFQSLAEASRESLNFFTKADLTRLHYYPRPSPDASFTTTKQKKTKSYFLDVIDTGVPRFALRGRIAQYVDYYDDGVWTKSTHKPFPSILFVCPDLKTQKYLNRYTAETLDDEGIDDIPVYFTNQDALRSGGGTWQNVVTGVQQSVR